MAAHKKHDEVQVFQYIVWYKQNYSGDSPSLRDICAACGIESPSVTNAILKRLEARGWLAWQGTAGILINGGNWTYIPPPGMPPAAGAVQTASSKGTGKGKT